MIHWNLEMVMKSGLMKHIIKLNSSIHSCPKRSFFPKEVMLY